ncbi:uncharacterized protein LOC8054196 isoform X1 [Sorghum bicolor]|nr:uncharacterized protein LOC8054196 isoform X1 [Sorghum bicolor]|eukprot:XP_002468282.2 uncharacterized protein LOC8054196 isoform X1 [Sorghum bicolor]
MGHLEKPPPNPRIAPTSHPEPAPPPPPTTSSARLPGTPWRAAQDTLFQTCVSGSGNSVGCQYKQDSRCLTDYGNRIDNEGIAKIFHSSESNNKDRVMEVLITDPNPASNHAVPQGDVYCYRDSASESTFVLTDTKAHYQSGAIIMSYVDGSPSLVSDTPCAFTEAYHHLMTATDGPEIGVSITSPLSVPYHIKTEVPSGINTLQGANRDPGLPVVDKDKHNLTPSGALSIGKAYELKFMHDEVRATPYGSSEEREFPKTLMVSDVSGLSSTSSWDEIATQRSIPTLRNCTDLCISIPIEVPERQHIRKRGPAHDPSSKITKRSKVNGNTLDSRSKDESKQLTQVRAKSQKSSEEQEFPNARLLSDISVLSAVYLDDIANKRFDSAPSNYDDVYGSVSAPGKSLNMEALDTNVHLRKRGQPETCDRSVKITKRPKVNGSNTSESNLKDDSRKLTQVFVQFGDTCISLQVNLEKTTVRELIFSAMNRKGIRSFDVYLLYCGRVLEEAYLLSVFSIPKDASFRVIPRLRAGQDQMLITYKTFDVIIKDMKPFYKVLLPVILKKKNATGDVYMVFLSQTARVLIVQLLIYLSYLHSEGWCFNGKFKITNFVFWNGNALMHPDIRKVRATGAGCQRDMVKLGEEIEKMFTRSNFPTGFGQLPGYVSHLVGLLKLFPIHKWQSKTYRLYLSNHPALLSFNERINKYLGMDVQYDFMNDNIKQAFSTAVGDFGGWEKNICDVEPLLDTYWHNPKTSKKSRFDSEGVSWLAVGRNFLSHPNEKRRGFGRKSAVPVGFTKEEAEAALAYYWKDNLAKFLLNVIDNFKPPANMDIKLLCGNDLVDPDSRGGKSGGTELGEVQS